ncbi:MAG: DUF1275 domain-containing protein [Oscillospiraceae bacterium]|nr:DUF1275 domain-containing protein [Oscillospiraceae bacterium]
MDSIHGISSAEHSRYLMCERKGVFELLMISAGMMGAYTYNLRGGVFCNAQTANVLLMSLAFGRGQWARGLYYLIPISAYIAGAFVSELLPNRVKKWGLLRWDTYLIGAEMVALFLIGFIPFSAPNQVVQVLINFICSMQYNPFRQAEGVPMATTFCTNHIRQIGISLEKLFRHRDRAALRRCLSHAAMVLCFLGGGTVLTAFCNLLGTKAIWLALLPLGADFCLLVHADLFQEHTLLWQKPLGH